MSYFVDGDIGYKQTTAQAWENVKLYAEEIACIVPIPENVLDDSEYDIWANVLPRLSEAIGATFDKVAGLAKMALMRPLDVPAADERIAQFEAELLAAVNATGIGAAALGGATTALGVRVQTAPCHIAALPLAINMGCSAMRRGTYELEAYVAA